MSRDFANQIAVLTAIAPIVGNDDTEGTGVAIDTQGYDSLTFINHFGISGDTLSGSVKVNCKAEKSVDSAFTSPVALVAAELFDDAGPLGAATWGLIDSATEDPNIFKIGIILDADYRYYRVLVDFTGTHTNGMPISAEAILAGGAIPHSYASTPA